MTYDFEEVCQFCYKTTSHKTNPTYTPRSKLLTDSSKETCSVCRREWRPQIIAVGKSGKAIVIRARPPLNINIDYVYCVSVSKGISCQKGLICTFAHHQAELYYWSKDRVEKEPRESPPSKALQPFLKCKAFEEDGFCSAWSRCPYAHSEKEIRLWNSSKSQTASLKNQHFTPRSPPAQSVPVTPGATTASLYCPYCNIRCTSQKQLDEHNQGGQHKRMTTMSQKAPAPIPTVAPMAQPLPTYTIRRRPLLHFQISDYRLCHHAKSNMLCAHGNACTFAHSMEELDQWNGELRQNKKRPLRINSFLNEDQGRRFNASERPSAKQPNVVYSMNEIPQELDAIESPNQFDFAESARLTLLSVWKNKQEDQDILKCPDVVNIEEISGRPLYMNLTQSSQGISWTFRISTVTPQTLQSIVLLDALCASFRVRACYLATPSQPVPSRASLDGTSVHLRHLIRPSTCLHVQIVMKAISDVAEQVILFQFEGDLRVVKPLRVQVMNEEFQQAVNLTKKSSKKPARKDLYWESRFHVEEYTPDVADPTDKLLKAYKLPTKIEQFLEEGRYNNMDRTVTKENYARRLHNLLYLEQYQQRKDLSRYDLCNFLPDFSESFTGDHGTFNMAPEGFTFMKLDMEEELFEGRRSIKYGDVALVLPTGHSTAYGCPVEFVGRQHVTVKLSKTVKDSCLASSGTSIRFTVEQKNFDAMHFAADNLDLTVVLPESSASRVAYSTKECMSHVDRSLNKAQTESIHNILNPETQSIPTLVCGPFGCGKTRTLRECVRLLLLYAPNTKLLLVTQNNSAADLYVRELDKELAAVHKARMFRLYYVGRNPASVSQVVHKYTKYDDRKRQFVCPLREDLMKFQLIVTTLQTARSLKLKKLDDGHFTHIFVDEAAQALECEAIIPLSLASSRKSKIILAGDKMQTISPVYSTLARKYGLDKSLLERLYDEPVYKKGLGASCRIELVVNLRSHKDILDVPSRLFYSGALKAQANFPENGPKDMPAINFLSVDGEERRDEDSPSYFNVFEAEKVADKVTEFCQKGLQQKDVCVLTLYSRQVALIRQLLRKRGYRDVQVLGINGVQGQEYRALILSTVRTCTMEPSDGEDSNFLSNPKLFNTAITRAQEWLFVVGDAVTLCTVGSNRTCWGELIHKCVTLGSFVYPSPDKFEANIENKLTTKQILSSMKEKYPQSKVVNVEPKMPTEDKAVPKAKVVANERVVPEPSSSVGVDKTASVCEPTSTVSSAAPNIGMFTSNAAQPQVVRPTPSPALDQHPQMLTPLQTSLHNTQNQLSVILTHERNNLMQRKRLLAVEYISHCPVFVQENIHQQKEILSHQIELLDQQIRLVSEMMQPVRIMQPHPGTFPTAGPMLGQFRGVGPFSTQHHNNHLMSMNFARMSMGYNSHQHHHLVSGQPRQAAPLPMKEPGNGHDFNWDDL